MPIFSFKPPNLEWEGATIEVTIYPPFPIIAEFRNKKEKIPSKRIKGLIDTGASCTAFDVPIAKELNLITRDFQKVLTPSGESDHYLYDIVITLGDSTMGIPIQGFGAELSKQPCNILLGRDILRACTLVYNGWDSSYDLHIHQEKIIYY